MDSLGPRQRLPGAYPRHLPGQCGVFMVSASRSLWVLILCLVWGALGCARAGAQSTSPNAQGHLKVLVLDPNTLRPVADAPWYAMSAPTRVLMARLPWRVGGTTGPDGTGRLVLPVPVPKNFVLGVNYIGGSRARPPSCGDLRGHPTFNACSSGLFSTRQVVDKGEVSPSLYCPSQRKAATDSGPAQRGAVRVRPGEAVIFAVRASPVRAITVPGPASSRYVHLRVIDAGTLRPVRGALWMVRCTPGNLAWATWAEGRVGEGESTFELPQPAPAVFYVFYGYPGEYASCSTGRFDTLTVVSRGEVSPNLCDRGGHVPRTPGQAIRTPLRPRPG